MAFPPKPPEAIQTPAPPAQLRTIALSLTQRSFEQSDLFHRDARAFRNRLVVTSLMGLAAGGLLVVVQWRLPTVRIIHRPSDATGLSPWALLLLVMGFGSLGALISTIPAMAAIPRAQSPFNFPLQQAYLKVIVGSLTGVIGVVLTDGTTITKGSNTVAALLTVATVFGAAQQAITQYLDRRAGEIIKSGP